MKITKVTYQKAYIIGPYLQEKVGFEAEIEDTVKDSAAEALSYLKGLADTWHNANNPQPMPSFETEIKYSEPNANGQPPTIDYKKVESWEAEIDNCTDLEQLEKWISDHPAIPGKLLSIVNKRRNELKNNANG